MTSVIQQLITDVADVTGAAPPAVLAADAPVLQDHALAGAAESAPYFIGLIGGKDVGKSALVNALVGEPISASTAFGPGTETVIAYVHEVQEPTVKALLEREAAGRYRLVVHKIAHLERQVLLDLPDIDSRYGDHLELTRRMLRHMLFPVWIQSVEKYADRQPQELLAAVAAGNDPANFVFCLNKADQMPQDAGRELREDYAARLARTLGRPDRPPVYVISALHPDQFDFPALRAMLAQQKTDGAVRKSMELAGRQRQRSMLGWLESQRLPQRVQRLARLQREAEDLTAARLTGPLLETVIPRLIDDPTHRAAMVEEVMSARVSRWPIVNVLHTLLSPLTAFWRRNIGTSATTAGLVESSLAVQGRPMADAVQATFALLQQTHPSVSSLYRQHRLWEAHVAAGAAVELRDRLIAALAQQRTQGMQRIARRGLIAPLIRWLLTVGAVLWFPIVQPVLELLLKDQLVQTVRGGLVLAVQLLSATYLLRSAAFLAIWFVFLWLVLRWDTYRRVVRLLSRWRGLDVRDASVNPSAAVLAWGDELLDPIRTARHREESLAQRAQEISQEFSAAES